MALNPGDRIGHYEVLSLLGAGGMGVVYRARDSRLNRHVAIKVLPDRVVNDRDRLERFQREATTLASLNHPNIAQVYGLEFQGDSAALIMELIDGEELSRRIGQVSIDDVVAIASQVVSALEAAHAAGIVHRDLKPANIMIRADGTVRILDFGLAKVVADAGAPTMTEAGSVVGTAAYMSPEQARGRPIDKRSDIWSFGCVLYELLAGRRAFPGESAAEALAAVLEREPDWTALPSATPPPLRSLLAKCFQRDAARRLRDIGDAHFDLDEARAPSGAGIDPHVPSSRSSRIRETIAWSAAAIAALAIGFTSLRPSPPPAVTRFALAPPPNETFGSLTASAAISPDGRHVAFVSGVPGNLWIRALDKTEPTRIAGTEGALMPFWSADSRNIGFFVDRRLLRTDLAGAAPQLIARVPPTSEGGSWSATGTILFGTNNAGIFQVPASGGTPVAVTTPTGDEAAHHSPAWLPDQQHFLYRAGSGTVFVASIGGGAASSLVNADARAEFVAPDIVLFVQGQDLVAQRLNLSTFKLRGSPTPVVSQVRLGNRSRASFSASANTLLYRNRPELGDGVSLQVLDTDGQPSRDLAIGQVRRFNVSADGRFLAIHAHETNTGDGEVWIVDVRRGSKRRAEFDGAHFDFPVWSPDGTQVVVSTGRRGLVRATVGTRSAPESIYARFDAQASDWSRDGKWIILQSLSRPGGDFDIWALPMAGAREPQPLARTRFDERDGVVSPDGRWLAYTSDESGRREVYLQSFPGDGTKHAVSIDGGAGPRWDDKGRLYYWSAARKIVRVTVRSTTGTLEFSEPEPVVEQQLEMLDQNFQFESGAAPYVVLPNNEGFVRAYTRSKESDPLHLVMNWTSLLTWRD